MANKTNTSDKGSKSDNSGPPASPTIPVVRTIRELRSAVAALRHNGERVALVPTMGALHEGHVSLVRSARRRRCLVVTSIFVNPTQFAPTEDFGKYPRTFENDCRLLQAAGCHLVYAPTPETVYPAGFTTTITPGGPALVGLEDHFRPTHFVGVATVVAKLFTQVKPDIAIFGEKDYQQLLVVRRMARDLDLEVEVVGAPTIREADGLALSSRNRYLSAEERERASLLPQTLKLVCDAARSGTALRDLEQQATATLGAAGYAVDYVAFRDAETLNPASHYRADAPIRLLAAARLGSTRLIDNWPV